MEKVLVTPKMIFKPKVLSLLDGAVKVAEEKGRLTEAEELTNELSRVTAGKSIPTVIIALASVLDSSLEQMAMIAEKANVNLFDDEPADKSEQDTKPVSMYGLH